MAALYFKDKEIQGNLNYISVEGETINNQEKNIEITEKGTYEVTYDEGYTGLEKVNIDVNIQGGDMEIVEGTQIKFKGSTFIYFPQQYVPLMNSTTNYESMLEQCNQLVTFAPENLNTSNVTTMTAMFYYCTKLTLLDLSNFDTSNVTNMRNMFYNCSGLTSLDVSNFNTSQVTNMGNMFYGCSNLTSLDISNWNTSNVTTYDDSINTIFSGCKLLTKVDGFLDLSKATKLGYNNNYAFAGCPNLRKIEFRNLGMQSNFTKGFFIGNGNGMQLWGENSSDIPDARDSMINTLITYSFDRASAGYSNCTITMHSNAKARLTEEEIAQITSKGYTLA